MTIRHDGYYCSIPAPWEDPGTNVRACRSYVHYWRFYSDQTYIKCKRDDGNFDFWAFTESLTDAERTAGMLGYVPRDENGEPMFTVGKYDLQDAQLRAKFGPDSTNGMTIEWDLDVDENCLDWNLPNGDPITLEFRQPEFKFRVVR